MSKGFLVYATAIILVGIIVSFGEALECYSCFHMEGNDINDKDLEKLGAIAGMKGHKSCKSGKKPKDDLIETCKDNATPGVSSNTSCVKVFAKASFLNSEYKVTLRRCFDSTQALPDKCESKTIQDVLNIMADSDIKSGLEKALADNNVPASSSGNVCACEVDKCNHAPVTRMISWALLMITASILCLIRNDLV